MTGPTTPREEMIEMEDRLRLEFTRAGRQARQARSLALVTTAVAVAALFLALTGPAGRSATTDDGVVTAKRLVLQDENGRTRGEWLVESDGTSRIVMSDQAGAQRMTFSVLSNGSPGLSLSDHEGRRRVVVGLLPDQTANLVFADASGTPRAVLGISAEQSADLVFADRDGNSRVALGVDASGQSSLILPSEEEASDGNE